MDPVSWEQARPILHAALDRSADERRAFVETACADDPVLRAYVSGVLENAGDGAAPPEERAPALHAVLDGSVPVFRAVGPYRVLSVIDQGGMGVVYLAEREDIKSRVAIKVLRDASLSPARRERFAREERVLAKLTHPAIARLYDADVLPDGTPYFVMEYVEGAWLTRYCDANACSVDDCLRLVRGVCEAVQYAHGQLVIHRDLKPSNILVAAPADAVRQPTVKLLDFGIAKQLDDLDAARTHTALRLMTRAYAAPEQLLGQPTDVRTDVYALGMILYELLTGDRPFDRPELTSGQIETLIVERDPPRPSVAARRAAPESRTATRVASLGAGAWADLDVLCLTALQKDPARRYQTVLAFMQDIDRYLRHEPLQARPDTLAYRTGKFVRRNRSSLATATLVVALVVGLVAFYTARLTAARDSALAAVARMQRIERFTMGLFVGEGGTAPPESLRVVTLVGRGVRDARLLDREPAVQAELYQTLGEIYRGLGDFPRADSLLGASLARRRALTPANPADVGRSLVALGQLRVDQARFDDAERLVRSGVALIPVSGAVDSATAVDAAISLGTVLTKKGKYADAAPVLADAARRAMSLGDDAALEKSLNRMANNEYYLGHFAAADSLNRRVLQMALRRFGPHHVDVADQYINLAALRREAGDFVEAERLDRLALAIYLENYGPTHHETAAAQTYVAQDLVGQKRYDEAAGLLRTALAVRERVYGPNDPHVATTLNELGSVASMQGDLATAEREFTQAADVYRRAYGGRHQQIGTALSNLGSVLAQRGEFARAERAFVDALAQFAATLPPGHIQVAITQLKFGRALLLAHRPVEARAQLLAAYEAVRARAEAPPAALRRARTDLVAASVALGDSAGAARYRAELARAAVDSASRR